MGTRRPGPPPPGGDPRDKRTKQTPRPLVSSAKSNGILSGPLVLIIGWALIVCAVGLVLSYFVASNLRGETIINPDWWSISFASFLIMMGTLILAGATCITSGYITLAVYISYPLLVTSSLLSLGNSSQFRGLDRWSSIAFGVAGFVTLSLLTYEIARSHLWSRELVTPLAALGLIAAIGSGVFFFVDGWWINVVDFSSSATQSISDFDLDGAVNSFGSENPLSDSSGFLLNSNPGLGIGERWNDQSSGISAIGSVVALIGVVLIPILAGILRNQRLALALAVGSLLTLIFNYLPFVWNSIFGNLSINGPIVFLAAAIAALIAIITILIRALDLVRENLKTLVTENL